MTYWNDRYSGNCNESPSHHCNIIAQIDGNGNLIITVNGVSQNAGRIPSGDSDTMTIVTKESGVVTFSNGSATVSWKEGWTDVSEAAGVVTFTYPDGSTFQIDLSLDQLEDNGDGTYTWTNADGSTFSFGGGGGASDGVVTDVALSGTSLDFTGQGGGFNGSIDLSSIDNDTVSTLVDNGDGTFTHNNGAGSTTTFNAGWTEVSEAAGVVTFTYPDGATAQVDLKHDQLEDNGDGTYTWTNADGSTFSFGGGGGIGSFEIQGPNQVGDLTLTITDPDGTVHSETASISGLAYIFDTQVAGAGSESANDCPSDLAAYAASFDPSSYGDYVSGRSTIFFVEFSDCQLTVFVDEVGTAAVVSNSELSVSGGNSYEVTEVDITEPNGSGERYITVKETDQDGVVQPSVTSLTRLPLIGGDIQFATSTGNNIAVGDTIADGDVLTPETFITHTNSTDYPQVVFHQISINHWHVRYRNETGTTGVFAQAEQNRDGGSWVSKASHVGAANYTGTPGFILDTGRVAVPTTFLVDPGDSITLGARVVADGGWTGAVVTSPQHFHVLIAVPQQP